VATPELTPLILFAASPGTITLSQVAKLAGVSVRTLQRKLKTEGWSYSGLVEESRIQAAMEMLRNEDLSLHQIAHTNSGIRHFPTSPGHLDVGPEQRPANSVNVIDRPMRIDAFTLLRGGVRWTKSRSR
jgi:hypothetical protein